MRTVGPSKTELVLIDDKDFDGQPAVGGLINKNHRAFSRQSLQKAKFSDKHYSRPILYIIIGGIMSFSKDCNTGSDLDEIAGVIPWTYGPW